MPPFFLKAAAESPCRGLYWSLWAFFFSFLLSRRGIFSKLDCIWPALLASHLTNSSARPPADSDSELSEKF